MFEHAKLESFKIERVYRPAAAIAEVEVDAVVNGRTTALRMRWAREEGDKGFVSPIEGVGSWKLWIGIPEAMIRLGSKSNVEEPIP